MAHKYSTIQNNSTNVRNNNYKRKFIRRIISLLYVLSPTMIEKFIKHQFFIPKSHPVSNQEKELLQSSKAFEISVNQHTIKCWKWGEGPFIILAHGWNGRGSQFILFIKKLIQAGHSVIIFDGPAHGQSEGKTSSYFQMTDAIRALINYTKPENIAGLIGHSFGSSAIINAISKERIETRTILLAPAINIKKILDDAFIYHGIPLNIFEDIISKYEQKYGYNLEDDNPLNLLKSIRQKLLIIHDEDDAITPYQESKNISETHDNIELYTSHGLGHKRILTDQKIISKVIEYLKK